MMAILTVKQINSFIKQSLSEIPQLKNLFISGEISNFKLHYQSGHMYFTLKDEKSQLNCVMFRSFASRLRFRPESGMKVLCQGYVDVFEGTGQYQLYVRDIQPQGVGALQLSFEQLKEKLQKQGIFAEEHKKSIPPYPQKIGVATSNTGAAVEDIKNILSRRYPLCDVVIVPTVVQGASAPADIVKSIYFLDSMGDIDTIIVGRGGGSLEDLSAFNTEAVALAVYHCNTPVISAVGHETDFTICDFAADLRAPTPSAAAELAVPDIRNEINQLKDTRALLYRLMASKLEREQEKIIRIKESSVLADSESFFGSLEKKLTDNEQKIIMNLRRILLEKESDLKGRAAALNALSPLAVLARGYSITKKDGAVLHSVSTVNADDELEILLADGTVKTIVTEVMKNE